MRDVGLLRTFVTTAPQNNQRLSVFAVVHPIAAANIDPQFRKPSLTALQSPTLSVDTRRNRTSICVRARMSRKPRSQSVTGVLSSSSWYRRNSIMVNCSFKATLRLSAQSNYSRPNDTVEYNIAYCQPGATPKGYDTTVGDAHAILVMDAGRILEQGTHAELLAANGRYAQMWALQQSSE